ncbi:lysophospholipid acyltransferase family protein [Mucilaginibacter phyllosphaerae]|uniref:KDO2-lipid IV(A) lauroyltransferase n=1 Tax=Mucilaginibacter phyllosphaerae TaxID=1812349 RepID=A0A4Y8AJF2_9SPHI|nr:lysophospholipid acyltransferase family protein [Mucilaginibacter phyllosphaerae]MBB3968230.1 KDO2-lipid IV(A) lauroyltransferase [Mucilaginibacter phyllosphaerae]TEW68762.1 lauroyl acyltransferase [Mucilaginibacter phyllosphaerae]
MLRKVALNTGIFFLYLVSLLPFWFLYGVADMIFLVLYYLVRYRRGVVATNLKNAFPDRGEAERRKIERRYYRYLADLMVETIKMITVSEKSLRKRMKPTNPELVAHYFGQNRSIIAAAGHYCNWEMAALAFGLLTNEKRIIVYKPQTNEVFNDMFNRVRARFGAILVAMRQTLRTMIALKNQLTFSVLVSDQTPNYHEINYFTNFLNQPTAVFLGIEKLAKLIDAAVIFYRIDRVKRGYYTYTLVPLIEQPKQTAEYEITEAHVRYLEKLIQEKPQYWLWSHRRWKYKPEDFNR